MLTIYSCFSLINFASNARYRRQTFVDVHDLTPKAEGPVKARAEHSETVQFLRAIKFAIIIRARLNL